MTDRFAGRSGEIYHRQMNYRIWVLVLLILLPAWGQTLDEIDQMIRSNQFEQAQVAVSKLLESQPDNPEVHKRQGYVLLLKSRANKDPEESQALRKAAREALVKARDLGSKDELLLQLIAGIPEDGGPQPRFSQNPEADTAMGHAEDAFAEKDYPRAEKFYRQAAELDPELYEAPLYHGDALLHQGMIPEACLMYQKATELRPNRETAYRYWGNALLAQGSVEEALERYAAAVVAEPTSDMAWKRGLVRWTKRTGATLGIPKIEDRSSVSEDGKTINLDVSAGDALAPWFGYSATRSLWAGKRFEEKYPGQEYRHTLAEEADALDAVASIASEMAEKDKLKLDADLKLLVELKKEGLMEAFIFFSRPTRGIFQDYGSYREKNREKLIRFVVDYVVQRDQL